MGGDYEAASEALQQGKPAATDRSRLTPLNHSFTLDLVHLSPDHRSTRCHEHDSSNLPLLQVLLIF